MNNFNFGIAIKKLLKRPLRYCFPIKTYLADKIKLLCFRVFKVGSLKVIIGSNGNKRKCWIITDMSFFNICKFEDWKKWFSLSSIDCLLAEHVLEHIEINEIKQALGFAFKFLKSGGRFRIAVPDGYNPSQKYIDYVKPGGIGPGADTHINLFNYKFLSNILKSQGFEIELIEYYDENGAFYTKEWSNDYGEIQRSSQNILSDKVSELNHYSLIMDGIKGACK